jgi:hypothetical protein
MRQSKLTGVAKDDIIRLRNGSETQKDSLFCMDGAFLNGWAVWEY